MVSPGTILAGRYEVGRTIGKGTMGVVIEARHLELNTKIAIKVLHDELATQAPLVERFLRGARAAAQLRDEHVCRVHDCGTLDGGVPFMVMELLSGCDLARLLEQTGPLPYPTAATYLTHACTAVAEAHAVGIVHRDLKPSNLFRTRRPDGSPLVKIVDFGLGKSINGQDLSMTQTQNVVGSPAYMAPEQLRSGKNVDARSDVWALGVVMYELLAKTRPFRGANITELALNITSDPPPPLPDAVPVELRDMITRCLQKEPGARFQSVAELLVVLRAFATDAAEEPAIDEATAAGTHDRVDTVVDLDFVTTRPRTEVPKPHDNAKRSRATTLMIAGGSALAGAAIMYMAMRSGHEPQRTPPTPAIVAPSVPPPVVPDATAPAVASEPIDAAVPDAQTEAASVSVDAGVTPARVHTRKRDPRDLGNNRM